MSAENRRLVISNAGVYGSGGVATVMGGYHTSLEARGWKPKTFIPKSEHSNEVQEYMGISATPLNSLTGDNKLSRLISVSQLSRTYKEESPYAAIFPSNAIIPPSAQLISSMLAGIDRRIVIPESDVPISYKQSRGYLLATHVVGISKHMKGTLEAGGVPDRKITVIHNGVDEKPAGNYDQARERKLLGIPQDAFTVGVVSRLVPEKRVEEALKGVMSLPENLRKNTHVVIAGSGESMEGLRDQAAQFLPGQVHFTGYVNNPNGVYATSNIVALLSDYEGLPLIIPEAAMHGVPSIVTDVGGNSEIVRNGETGFTIQADNTRRSAFGRLLEWCIEHPQETKQMGENVKKLAIAEHSLTAMGRKYHDLLTASR